MITYIHSIRRCGGTGRHLGLKIPYPRGCTGSSPVTGTTSPRTAYRSRRLFCKSHLSLILSRLLSESNPLRRASIRFSYPKSRPLFCQRNPRRRKLRIACDGDFSFRTIAVSRSLRCSSFQNRTRCAGLRFCFYPVHTFKCCTNTRATSGQSPLCSGVFFAKVTSHSFCRGPSPNRTRYGRAAIFSAGQHS